MLFRLQHTLHGMSHVPLAALFGKVEASSVQLSPGGTLVGWLARSAGGVLNIFVAPLPLPAPGEGKVNSAGGALQLTAATDRDICFSFRFTQDDSRIVFLRETEHGSELYHLHVLDIPRRTTPWQAPASQGRDLLAAHPKLTCAVGFVGGLQLWLPRSAPNYAILATGTGSLLWDLSRLDLTTGQLERLESNSANSFLGRVELLFSLLLHLICRFLCAVAFWLTMGCVSSRWLDLVADALGPAPGATVQYFVDEGSGDIVGCAQASLGWERGLNIALRFLRKRRRRWKQVCAGIPFSRLNMQMTGSAPASGTLRMDLCTLAPRHDEGVGASGVDDAVAIHTCDTADTTAYVRYPGGETLANDASADIDGFVTSASGHEVEAVIVTRDRPHLLPVSAGGRRLVDGLHAARLSLARAQHRDLHPDEVVMLVSRTRADDLWVVRVSSDTRGDEYWLFRPALDAGAGPQMQQLVASRPLLARLALAHTQSVYIPARDGERLAAYLTRPRSESASGHGALAMVLHGGPNARDYAGFVASTQLLAARGFAVLTVNYRGSTGFGQRFVALGNGALGGMFADVEDARRWAIQTQVADPRRIVIVGGSWGGYLALGAATGLGAADAAVDAGSERQVMQGSDVTHQEGRMGSTYAAVVAIVPLVCVGAANPSKAFRGDPLVRQYWQQVYGEEVHRVPLPCCLPSFVGFCLCFAGH